MPQRNERLLWMYIEPIDGNIAAAIDVNNKKFANNEGAKCSSCVSSIGVSYRLWLFRVQTREQSVATKFNKLLSKHINSLGIAVGRPKLKLKRQSNLPQPLVQPRLGPWPITDLGLHSVNDKYNGMLVSYTYHEGKYYHIPHLQLTTMMDVSKRLQTQWKSLACPCYKSRSNCCGVGCFECFEVDCPHCDGTGWKHFMRWANIGYQVDYSSKVPIAII